MVIKWVEIVSSSSVSCKQLFLLHIPHYQQSHFVSIAEIGEYNSGQTRR